MLNNRLACHKCRHKKIDNVIACIVAAVDFDTRHREQALFCVSVDFLDLFALLFQIGNEVGGNTETCDKRNCLRSGTELFFLLAAENTRQNACSFFEIKRTDTFRTVNFVRRNSHKVCTEFWRLDLKFAKRLNTVYMNQRRSVCPFNCLFDWFNRHNWADFVIDIHHRH